MSGLYGHPCVPEQSSSTSNRYEKASHRELAERLGRIGTPVKGANIQENSLGNQLRRQDILPPFRMFYSLEWAYKGYGALAVAPRGKLRSHRQFNPGYPNLLTYNIVDRHTYAYRGFYMDSWRGIDFLLARPEVDPTRIGVTGTRQGGGLTITTAAMRPEI